VEYLVRYRPKPRDWVFQGAIRKKKAWIGPCRRRPIFRNGGPSPEEKTRQGGIERAGEKNQDEFGIEIGIGPRQSSGSKKP